jgi:pimeloyl-ACP methyl ester carboxylesterase
MSEKIDGYFIKKPKAPYGVKRLAPELEPGMTFGIYEPPTAAEPKGIYYFNGSKLNERSLLMSEGLIYHELVPGHHFQGALQQENKNLPEFQRESGDNAYNEGWAEYASWLGQEMGLFRDPYSLCGRIMMDIFISTRLVADTGMNSLEWPRSRAIEFMKENVIESETQINTETLRYSVDIPGQALGYKLGSLKISELREKAQKALGDTFDIRKFHEAVLANGAMPLSVLEKHIDWFIEKEKARQSTITEKSKGTVMVDGTKISYSLEGEGMPCVVVNGSLYPKTFSENLKKHIRFIFVEYRNIYASDPPADVKKITLDTLVDDIEQVRQKLGYEKIAVLGHSVPGFIAPEYARKYPQHVSHIILIATPPRWTSEYQRESQEFWKSNASQKRKNIFQRNQTENTEEKLKAMPPGKAWAASYNANSPMYFYNPSYNSLWLWEGIEFNLDFVNHLLGKILAEHDISDIFSKIKIPVFLALGRYSYITPYQSWDAAIRKAPNITLSLFEKSGHYPMLEETNLFDKRIISWIESH